QPISSGRTQLSAVLPYTTLFRSDAADALVASLGGHASALAGDVAREEDVLRMFATIYERYGRLDALVNNAGIVAPATRVADMGGDRKSTRLNSSHVKISYAVFCL